MAQDFAKKKNTAKSAVKKKSTRAVTRKTGEDNNLWSWYFSGLFSGVLLCVIGYFSLTQLDNGPSITNLVIPLQSIETVDDGTGTELEFYEYLPQAQVEVNIVPIEISSDKEDSEADQITYLLQAASYLDPNEAGALRAQLILLNLDTRISEAQLFGRTWYRVQAGPFVGRNSMESAENILIENNIDPIRMRVPTL